MLEITSFSFKFKNKIFHALARVKKKSPIEYHVTVMNGELEAMLFGHHIFFIDDGICKCLKQNEKADHTLSLLRESVRVALEEELENEGMSIQNHNALSTNQTA